MLEFDKPNGKVLSAVLTPRKPSWVLVENPVNSIFQYIFDKKNFLNDNRPYYGLASIEKDKESLEAVYNIKLTEDSPYFLLNIVYKDLMIMKSKQNIAMNFVDQTNKFEEFIISQFEYQINNGTKYKLLTKGELTATNPYTQVLFFKKHYAMKAHEASIILDDIMLLVSMLYHGEGKNYNEIREILKQTCIDSRIQMAYKNVYEFLQTYLYENLYSSDPKIYELKSFAFLKWVIANDVKPIKQLSNQYGNYSYRYRKKKKNFEIVDFEYQKSKFVGIHNINTNMIVVITSTIARGKNKVAYLIALKLFDKITQTVYETQLATLTTKGINKILLKDARDCYDMVTSIEGSVFSENWKELPSHTTSLDTPVLPIFLAKNIQHAHYTSQANLPDYIYFDESTSTFYCAGLKFFTAPYLQCKQVNVLKYTGEETIKGINIDWFLSANRLEKLINGITDNVGSKDLIKEISLKNLKVNLDDLYFDNKVAQQCVINDISEMMSTQDTNSDKSDETRTSLDALNFDEMDFDLDLEIGSEIAENDDFNFDDLDFEIMEDDIVEYETENDSGSSSKDSNSDVPSYKLEKYETMQPYILSTQEVRFSQNTPRSLSYIKNGYRLIETVIAKTSWKTQYMYTLPAKKQFAFLARYIKWSNKLHSKGIESLSGKEALKYILFKEICLGMKVNFKMTNLSDLHEGTCYLQIDGQVGQYLAIEDPTDMKILKILQSKRQTFVMLEEELSGYKPGIYINGILRNDLNYDIYTTFAAIATDMDVIKEEFPKLELDESFLDRKFFKLYTDPIKSRDQILAAKINVLLSLES